MSSNGGTVGFTFSLDPPQMSVEEKLPYLYDPWLGVKYLQYYIIVYMRFSESVYSKGNNLRIPIATIVRCTGRI